MTDSSSAILELLSLLWGDPRQCSLLALLAVAALIDWRSYRIPNWLTLGGTAAALIYSALNPVSSFGGWETAALGWALGLGLFLPFYLVGVMGAGDVKLMGMVGAFLGWSAIGMAALFVFITGGVAALAFTALHRAWLPLAHNLRGVVVDAWWRTQVGLPAVSTRPVQASIGKLPYGVSIAVGTTVFVLARQLGLA